MLAHEPEQQTADRKHAENDGDALPQNHRFEARAERVDTAFQPRNGKVEIGLRCRKPAVQIRPQRRHAIVQIGLRRQLRRDRVAQRLRVRLGLGARDARGFQPLHVFERVRRHAENMAGRRGESKTGSADASSRRLASGEAWASEAPGKNDEGC